MRTLLGRAVAATVAGITLFGGASVALSSVGSAAPPSTSAPSTTPTDPTPSTTQTTTTLPTPTTQTTLPAWPDPVAVPGNATPSRGEQIQVAPTVAPPSTTTTLPEHALPTSSGEGRRVVYRKNFPMRVWLVDSNNNVEKTHLVSGRYTWNQPLPGTYSVFSRSSYTCNINNPHICWRYMVRFTKGPGGDNIGFHEIPTNTRNGGRLQSESQLGYGLSGGCVRQRTSDAIYMWEWAPVGTKVVVLQEF